MEYKGYTAKVSFDDEAMIFHGEVAGIADVVTFQADNAGELVTAFHDSVNDYLEFCAAEGKDPDKPFSGTFIVRGEPELHRSITQAAAIKNMNANQWVLSALRRQVSIDCADVSVVKTT
ncbi:MAG: type II toxin-antitoxin system HicB family antitoxin [Rhodospirillaceae bacterium]|nr:type II toxin-antitoxin system HicB family antitoxin [Rhodospirillales bacterium]